jgi:TolB-like protein/Tfp pilus assembly protein PilF
MSFFAELQRRNVYRVCIAYLALGWVVIEVTDTVVPVMNLPDWTLGLVIWLGIIGFPFALIGAWAFELTPEGLKRDHEADSSPATTEISTRKLDLITIVLLLVALAFFLSDSYLRGLVDGEPGSAQPIQEMDAGPVDETAPHADPVKPAVASEKSIAVLPFANMSADPEQEYFGDGIAEEILNGLAKLPDLQVVARTSAFALKGRNIDIREIGSLLNASHVLEGSVRKAGDRLRITAQLISVDNGYHLWSEVYDRSSDDIFAIQEEIAQAVVRELEVRLGLAQNIVNHGTDNTEAYNWFLRGNYYIERQTPEAFEKAIESYTKSIELDPGFAAGHGGLAYGLAYSANFIAYTEVQEKVRSNYRRALEIDNSQPLALLAQAVDAILSGYDFVIAERSIRSALATHINTTLATDAYWWLVLASNRRFDEALVHLRKAEKADPLSSLVKQGIGYNLAWQGEHQAAVPYLESAVELNSNDYFAVWVLSLMYVELDRLNEAEAMIRHLEGITELRAFPAQSWAILHTARGDRASAEQVLQQLLSLYKSDESDPMIAPTIGIVCTHLGLFDDAITWFERSAEIRSPFIQLAPTMFYDTPDLWEHPRFQALMRELHLDDESVQIAISSLEESAAR